MKDEKIKRQKPFSKKDFLPNNNCPESKYGLPPNVEYCSSCVISNQRPNSSVEFKNEIGALKQTIAFDETGKCDACGVMERKQEIDWGS